MFPNNSLDKILENTFDSTATGNVMFIGLKGPGDAAVDDTLASHSGWSEVTDYTGDRQEWDTDPISNQEISNSTTSTNFSITGSVTVAGIFITDDETGTTGILYEVEDFNTENTLESGDILEVTHAIANG